jgi:hypothetical protein
MLAVRVWQRWLAGQRNLRIVLPELPTYVCPVAQQQINIFRCGFVQVEQRGGSKNLRAYRPMHLAHRVEPWLKTCHYNE